MYMYNVYVIYISWNMLSVQVETVEDGVLLYNLY